MSCNHLGLSSGCDACDSMRQFGEIEDLRALVRDLRDCLQAIPWPEWEEGIKEVLARASATLGEK